MEITMALLKQLRPEIEAALADLGKKYGIGFEVGSGSYNGSHATLKLEVGVLGDAGKAVGILQIHPTWESAQGGNSEPVSLLPLDVGFDLKATKHLVRLSGLDVTYEDGAGRRAHVSGCLETVAETLAQAGYGIVAAKTPTGRDVQCTPTADAPSGEGFCGSGITWAVQARNDNYWCRGPSILAAVDRAGWRPDEITPLAGSHAGG